MSTDTSRLIWAARASTSAARGAAATSSEAAVDPLLTEAHQPISAWARAAGP
eukprot:CAMPEP_0172869408 /NCGR_PEP_ID=MMETSP1075-20121228/88933_1 /TAXON_ID=2916 /ORGANISM="Ceratium fusus, Strain PA161109" /LENGTH=51 /DNA_ID=CAMNT_0013719299 /DNA_START=878 /DNA_END=1033 /DNA_ORIENTATION=+